jgi:hypothetical protein
MDRDRLLDMYSSTVRPSWVEKMGMEAGITPKEITIENSTTAGLYVILSADPNSTKVHKGGIGVSAITRELKFEGEAKRVIPISSKVFIASGKTSKFMVPTTGTYVSVVQKKSDGLFYLITEDRYFTAGSKWTIKEDKLLGEIRASSDFPESLNEKMQKLLEPER